MIFVVGFVYLENDAPDVFDMHFIIFDISNKYLVRFNQYLLKNHQYQWVRSWASILHHPVAQDHGPDSKGKNTPATKDIRRCS